MINWSNKVVFQYGNMGYCNAAMDANTNQKYNSNDISIMCGQKTEFQWKMTQELAPNNYTSNQIKSNKNSV